MTDDDDTPQYNRRRARRPLYGVPVVTDTDAEPPARTATDTSPFDLLVRDDDGSDERRETARRLRGDSRDPYDLITNLTYWAKSKALGPELERQVIEAIHVQAREMKALRSAMKLVKWIGGILASLILPALAAAVPKLWALAEQRGEERVLKQQLEDRIRRLEERPNPSPAPRWAPDFKGPP